MLIFKPESRCVWVGAGSVAETGILSMPSDPSHPIGGHEVVAVGYDQSKRMLKIRNSWGPTWGLAGYFWMPYEYYTTYSDKSYLFLDAPIDYKLKPFPKPAKPAPQPERYDLTVGPVNAAQMAEFEALGRKLHVPILKHLVK